MTTQDIKEPEDLIQVQLRLEEEMTQRGADRFLRNTSRATEGNREDQTAYGRTILAGRITKLADAITAWQVAAKEGASGLRNSSAYKLIGNTDAKVLAFLALKHVLSGLSTPRTVQFVAVAIGTAIEDEVRFANIREEERKLYDKIVKGAKQRTSARYKHIYATRLADNHDEWEGWSRTDRLHVGVKLLDILQASIGLIEIGTNGEGTDKALKYVKPLPSTLEWITKKNDATSLLRPVYEPMVVQPRDWTTPYDGGYLSSDIKPLVMVKTKNRAYLEELVSTDMPIVYDALNAIQRTAWQINSKILEVMKTFWDNGTIIAGMPPREGMELPVKPHDIDTNPDALAEYRKAAFKVHQENLSLMGSRISLGMTVDIAGRYEQYRKIFFPYQLDFRGRIYAVPHINPQGPDYQKGLLRFANGKPLGEEGWKWLAVHGANVAGFDKASLEDRVHWILKNEEEILRIAHDPFENRGWASSIDGVEIDKPWQFLAFALEWSGYVAVGESFVSKIPVAMDGSCSGIQHFSAMLRDEKGGAAVNLVPQDLPADVYRQVADLVSVWVKEDSTKGTEDTLKHSDEGRAYVVAGTKALASQWLAFGITRKTTKRSVMTLAYGSKEYGFKEQLMEDILWPAKRSATLPDGSVDASRFPFSGDGFSAAVYMAHLIWGAVNQVLVKAGEAMAWLQDAASLAAKEGLPVRWTTPVGFPVMQAYPALEPRRVKTAINGSILFLLMNQEKEGLDSRKQSQGISPNFVHSCDASHLMLTVHRAKQAGIHSFAMIHDSFGTTAGETETLYRVVRESFIEMYTEVDVLGSFRDELLVQLSEKQKKKLKALPESGTLELAAVADSRFCFA
ncbi:DNA-directed RNA polymerase [Pseudoduganella lutea]|uniref:DNA-directed RNA polymerase n=1 Tax=Pseudoduganella lutea TaxID=321985 RepID=A0A4P6L7A8_9BURK|nr:DNA-directed RNA polymerase [Pseudoduganella lutea]QBE66858.1 DNA-dependent RNA polymerase [Pseudoduganella lutea]